MTLVHLVQGGGGSGNFGHSGRPGEQGGSSSTKGMQRERPNLDSIVSFEGEVAAFYDLKTGKVYEVGPKEYHLNVVNELIRLGINKDDLARITVRKGHFFVGIQNYSKDNLFSIMKLIKRNPSLGHYNIHFRKHPGKGWLSIEGDSYQELSHKISQHILIHGFGESKIWAS